MRRNNVSRRAVAGVVAVVLAMPVVPAFAAPPAPPGSEEPGGRPPPGDNAPPPGGGGGPPAGGGGAVDTESLPTPPQTRLDTSLSGGLPLRPPEVSVPPPAPAPPRPDTQYGQTTACVTPQQDQANVVEELITRPFAQDALQIDQAHTFAKGKDQRVAVIDTGVNVAHRYFEGRAQGRGDYVTDANGEEDCDGHGTIVAGIIAGNTDAGGTDEDIGFNGMAPQSTIYSIRQTSGNYQTGGDENSTPPQRTAGTIDTLAQSVAYAASLDVDAINISLTGCQSRYASSVPAAFRELQAAIRWAVEVKDTVVVAAAGNLDASCPSQNGSLPESVVSIPMPPWFADDVLSVASIDRNGGPSQFSIAGPWVSVAAPGEQVISLSPANDEQLVNQRSEKGDDKPQQIVGTSFAAPYVTGLVALVRERYPELNAREVMRRIKRTAQHPSGPGGRDYQVGYGMINPVAALTDTVPGESGIEAKPNTAVPARIEPPYEKNWTPTLVALIGTGTGLALLVLTIFTVRTVQRNRRRSA